MAEPTNELLRRIQENIADLTNGLQEIRGRAGNREVRMCRLELADPQQ